jgi:hypothetical protein
VTDLDVDMSPSSPDRSRRCDYVCFFSISRRLQTFNPADACRAHLRPHCERAVPCDSSWLAFGSSQCRLLWARPRPRTRLIRRSQNACVGDLSLGMARRYTRTVLTISRGVPDCLLVNQLFVAPREKESSAHAVGHSNRASDQGTAI